MSEVCGNRVSKLVNEAKNGDKQALSKLIEENTGLIWSVVRRFSNRGYELEDLFQIGSIGFIKAVNKFDTTFGVRFSTYAVPMIIGEIKRFIRDDGLIKVSRSLKEIALKARIARETIQKETGRDPTVGELAEKLEIPVEELVMSLEASIAPESLYAAANESDSSVCLMDRIEGEYGSRQIDIVDRIALKQVLNTLSGRERQIIFYRYFKEKTQMQVAKIFGISQVQVSRIEKKILEDLRKKIQG